MQNVMRKIPLPLKRVHILVILGTSQEFPKHFITKHRLNLTRWCTTLQLPRICQRASKRFRRCSHIALKQWMMVPMRTYSPEANLRVATNSRSKSWATNTPCKATLTPTKNPSTPICSKQLKKWAALAKDWCVSSKLSEWTCHSRMPAPTTSHW